MIYRVTNYDGKVIDDFQPEVTDVLPAAIARLELSMLREVVNSGTATIAKILGRPLAGKTGTTNEYADAWFIGFSPSLTAGVWVGFDDRRSLGEKEQGSRVALPIWIDFMREALKDRPVEGFPHSPLLTNPEQVKQILASAGAGEWLASTSELPAGSNVNPQPGTAGVTRAASSAEPVNRAPTVNAGSEPASQPSSGETDSAGTSENLRPAATETTDRAATHEPEPAAAVVPAAARSTPEPAPHKPN
jgi:penicillin-binding protein 1A